MTVPRCGTLAVWYYSMGLLAVWWGHWLYGGYIGCMVGALAVWWGHWLYGGGHWLYGGGIGCMVGALAVWWGHWLYGGGIGCMVVRHWLYGGGCIERMYGGGIGCMVGETHWLYLKWGYIGCMVCQVVSDIGCMVGALAEGQFELSPPIITDSGDIPTPGIMVVLCQADVRIVLSSDCLCGVSTDIWSNNATLC